MHPSQVPQATQTELNKFVKVVDEFKAKYARLISPATKSQVYASGDQTLINEYESAVSRGGSLNNSINALVGAWGAFKRGYGAVTDVTSTVIGDAIDTVRGWFGYDAAPGIGGMGSLGLIQIPAAVAIAGIVGAFILLLMSMKAPFRAAAR